MPVLDSELRMVKSSIVTDGPTNGGPMGGSSSLVTSATPGNVFDPVFRDELTAGSTKFRKTNLKVNNDDDLALFSPRIWLDRRTPGDDWVLFFGGSHTDVEGTAGAGITGTSGYGCAILRNNVLATSTSIVVTVEDSTLASGADALFRDGDTIRLTNMDLPTSGVGTHEFHTISGIPSVTGNDITLTLATGLLNDYNVDDNTYGTRVMSVYEPADIESTITGFVVTTAGDGTYDDTTYPPKADNIACMYQKVTLTFTSATSFTAASDQAGITLTGGTVVANGTWEPNNPDFTKPYFVLDYNGFNGTWASGDTLEFYIYPMAAPFWQKRVIPAGATALSGNLARFVFTGESL